MEQKTKDVIGEVVIADEVFQTIVGLAAADVKGVYALAGGVMASEVTRTSKKVLSKCVRVTTEDGAADVRVALILDGSVSIPEVSENTKEKVTQAIEAMAGMTVRDVQVTIAGVHL